MARHLPAPFYDGYTYSRGGFEGRFMELPTGAWVIAIADEATGEPRVETGPVACRFAAYRLAQAWIEARLAEQVEAAS